MDIAQKIGQEIRRARKRMNLSQKQFAALIGKSESQVGAYENATSSIAVDTLFKIAQTAKMDPGELFTGSKEKRTGWDAELRVYSQEDRKTVMAILAVNGYDVGQHKVKATPTGKTVRYYIHATDREGNADTSK